GARGVRWGPSRSFCGFAQRRRLGQGDARPRTQRRDGFGHQLVEYLTRRLLACDEADALSRHQRAALDIALDHGAAQRARPEMLDLELRVVTRDLAAIETIDDRALTFCESLCAFIGERPHRNDREARIDLHREHGVARAGAQEGLLEAAMRYRFTGTDETRPELHARRAHFEIGDDRFAAADAAGNEDRNFAERRQNLLRQDAGRDRAD